VNTTIPTYQSQLSRSPTRSPEPQHPPVQRREPYGIPGATSSAGAPPYAGAFLPSIFVNNASPTTYTPGSGSAQSIAVNRHFSLTLAPRHGIGLGDTRFGDHRPDHRPSDGGGGTGFRRTDDLYQALVGLVGSQTSEANNNQTSAQALSDSTAAQLSSVTVSTQSGDSQHALGTAGVPGHGRCHKQHDDSVEALLAAV